MRTRQHHRTRRVAVVLPGALAAFVAISTGGAALAASPTSNDPATAAAGNASANANGGVGQGNGNGNAKHVDPTTAAVTPTQSTTTTSTTSTTTSSSSADHSDGNAGTSGDANSPQPPSNADKNPGGANGDQCSTTPKATYCSTRDGRPSANGNGGGKATGKPCMGCVGKADNKNPPGQEKHDPMGTFPNNGYECDRNHGIGKGNPAHTGCQSTPPTDCKTTGTCPEPPCDEAVEDCSPPECDEAVEDCTPNPPCKKPDNCKPPQVCDERVEDCTPPQECVPTAANNFCSEVEGNKHHRNDVPTVLGERFVRPSAQPNALPFTGASNIGILLASGLLTVGLGAGLLVLAGRRARTT